MATQAQIIDDYFREKDYYPHVPYSPIGEILVNEVERMGPDGLYLSTACALVEQESGGKNLFGCFAPGALVRVESGYKPIEDVRKGERVLTADGGLHPVARNMRRLYEGPVYAVNTPDSTREVLVTPEHPALIKEALEKTPELVGAAAAPLRSSGTAPGYAKLDDVRTGQHLVCGALTESEDRETLDMPEESTRSGGRGPRRRGATSIPLTPENLWALGLYIAEGSTSFGLICFSLNAKEESYAERLRAVFEGLGYRVRFRTRKDRPNSLEVTVGGMNLYESFPAWFGRGSDNKRIPAELFNLSVEKVRHVLRGILDGDGTYFEDKEYGAGRATMLNQTSEVLALQVAEISRRLGGTPSIHIIQPKGKKPCYRVWEAEPPAIPVRRKGRNKRDFRRFEGGLASRIELCPVMYFGPVYNLEVEDDHSYVVQGGVWHNCDWGPKWTDEPPYCQVAVTKDRVKKLIANVGDGGGQNGVGYTQLTSIGYVREAEEEGGAHLPRSNVRVGFRILNGHIANLGWPAGAAAYNAGAGNWQAVIDTYGAEMSSKERAWAERLEKATKDEVSKPVSASTTGNSAPKEKTPWQLAEEAIELGTKLLGTPYGGGWKDGTWPEGPSLYARCDPKVHTVSFAKSHEIICSAFVNFLRAHVAGLPAVGRAQGDGWPGGTAAFWRTFGRMKGSKPYPPVENTPRGWLVYSPYLGPSLAMQGHVGIALGNGKVLEARVPTLSNNRTENEGHRALIAGGGQGYTTIIPPSIWLRV